MADPQEPNRHGFFELDEAGLEKLAVAIVESKAGEIAGAAAALLVKVLTGSSVVAGAAETAVANSFGKWVADNPDARLKKAALAFARADRKAAATRDFALLVQQLITDGLQSVENSLGRIERGQQRAENTGRERHHALEELMIQALRGQAEQFAALRQVFERLTPYKRNGQELLAAYRESVGTEHNRPLGLFSEQLSAIDTIFVELEIGTECTPSVSEHSKQTGLTLRELLARSADGEDAQRAPRWVVLGDPGAGKSTLARHLAWELARSGDDSKPLAVYVSLPELAKRREHPFKHVENLLKAAAREADGEGLQEELFSRAKTLGRLWLLLDGLDEVAPAEDATWVQQQLAQWAAKLPKATIAVFSRRVGYQELGDPYRALARIQPLSDAQQRELLGKWLGNTQQAAQLWREVQSNLGLRDACRVPLILSLLAYLVRSESNKSGHAPVRNKLQLYDRSLTELLKRGHGGKKNGGVRNPDYARHILARLSLALLVVRPGESWTRGELDNTLLAIQADDKQVAQRLCSWADASAFLNDVSDNSGVLAPQDGPRSPWRFLHRQFRELLAAEALHDRGDEVILSQARELHRQDVPRWAEILGFACELAQEPLNILRALGEVNEELALRVLPELERVDCIKALELLRKDGKWDGDFLTGLLERWIEQSALNRQQAVSWLWNQVTSSRSVHELSYVHYTLEQLAGSVDRESFFQACGRWPSGGPSEPRLDLLPGGTFLMGSRYRVEDWNDDEVPQHAVTLSAFWLNASAMTNEEYERFDPRHHRESFDGQLSHAAAAHHPVVNVSYWEAYLCSRWYGCSLPTEAQWEYACRAGTNTSFSYGDDISPENVNHATIEPSSTVLDRQRTVAVKSLPANAWQLYEMHGNVWEWCSDRFGAYAEEHQSDPKGTFGSSARVLRGGSWNDHAWFARSASREGRSAGYRSNTVGLRLARQPGEAHK